MRECIRCKSEMVEQCDLKVQGAGYGVVLTSNEKIFSERLGKPKIAICPNCGEISIYMDDVNKLKK